MRQSTTAWLFDVDGVLADPKEKKIEEALFHHIIEKLKNNEPVCLNTGRSTTWMEQKILKPLLQKMGEKTIIENFIAIGEKGGTWMKVDTYGNISKEKDSNLSMPEKLHDEIKRLIEQKYNDVVDYDYTKETMISVEMKDGYDLNEFAKKQQELIEDLKLILKEANEEHDYKIDPTISATDIENNHVGKGLGTDRFLHWLSEKGVKPEKFVAFGDSISDIEMADELERRGEKVTFVYVGDPQKLKKAEEEGRIKNKAIIEQVGDFTQGTLSYLNK